MTIQEKLAARHLEFYRTTDARTIVFVRIGDFYETIGTDAMLVADVCGLPLTEMTVDGQKRFLAGIPYHGLERCRTKLADSGWTLKEVDLEPAAVPA